MSKPKAIAVVGPTASGKTSLSIQIAERFSGEIISCDSRQVYKKLDIGTGKVTVEEARGIPHHLIDVVDVNATYTVTNFVNEARLAIVRILKRDHLPIIAGGTFFYLDQLRGKSILPAVPPNQKLRDELNELTTEELLKRLEAKDPERAANIDVANRRRLIRALEVIEELGKVPKLLASNSPYDWLIIGIKADKELLRHNFEKRLNGWLEAGLLKEVEWLRGEVSLERFQEFGFEYTLSADFTDGKINNDEFVKKFVEKNWQYAKRQMTWLKRDEEVEWYSIENREEIFERVKDFLEK